jgi:hypothetical protein
MPMDLFWRPFKVCLKADLNGDPHCCRRESERLVARPMLLYTYTYTYTYIDIYALQRLAAASHARKCIPHDGWPAGLTPRPFSLTLSDPHPTYIYNTIYSYMYIYPFSLPHFVRPPSCPSIPPVFRLSHRASAPCGGGLSESPAARG